MLKLYNTLTRKKEVFKSLRNKKVNFFVCGPTVYDFSHIGHARTYVIFDVIVKYLRQKRYDVFYLQNITDIDDKIINRAKEKKISPQKLARDFEKEYLKDIKDLKINSVTKYARATEHIKEIINQVQRLLKKGYAYQIEDGIYYDISKFKEYGKLSKRTVLQAEDAVSRIDESKEKRNKGDFCLWKFSKEGEPVWPASFGRGRPGWHIEDTAITEKYFGPQYDIHGGAKDLIFPHHEAEIAQMEAISGKKPMVKYWLHLGFLTVNGRKMAKSFGNFISIKDFLKENPARLLRFLIIKTLYRSPINYKEKLLLQTKKELERIEEFIKKMQNAKCKMQKNNSKFKISKFRKDFDLAMEDDFNTPKAVAVIFELINKGNSLIDKNKISSNDAKNILNLLKNFDEVLGINLKYEIKKLPLPQEILNLVKERERYREQKNWKGADEIRSKIRKMGYWVEDTEKGPKLKKVEID